MSNRQERKKRHRDRALLTHMHYDLRSPCGDCPFRNDAPFHEGIAADMPAVLDKFLRGELAHTCHTTDPRADCPAEKRAPAGQPIQHCAGMLIMALKTEHWQDAMLRAAIAGKWDDKRMNLKAPVFDSVVEMILHYIPGIARKYPHHPDTKRLLDVAAALKEHRA